MMDFKMRVKHLISLILLVASVDFQATEALKLDCYPTPGSNKDGCEARGCIWSPANNKQDAKQTISSRQSLPGAVTQSRVDEPWCYFPDDYVGYTIKMNNLVNAKQTRALLVRQKPSGLPDDINELDVLVEDHGSLVRIKISDKNKQRFEPELPVLRLQSEEASENSTKTYDLKHNILPDGRLVVERKSTGAVLFDTDLTKLIYSNKFIQLNSKLNSPFLYGLGEHYDTFLKVADSFKTYSFWNTDRLTLPGGTRSYGGFPFYVNIEADMKHAHGVYLRNSDAMDIVLQSDQSITFRPIGGVLDFILFEGPTPMDVTSQYQHAVGLPQLPPRWSLGFHLCRYNYNSLDKTKLVWQRTREAKIPFDVQWNDIDYMDKHNDFTYDHDKFAGLPEFVKELHDKNMHYVPIIDPGVSQEPNYKPYELGQQMDVFVKNATNQTLVAKVWNDSGRTVFPDFSNPRTVEYWKQLFILFQKEVAFDGAWIDMNDISNFLDGSLDGCPQDNELEKTIYEPGGYALKTKTLCLSARHQAGSEYDVHNLYSFYEAIATNQALRAARPNKRPLIISRSTAPGQGQYGGHWSGDVLATWDYLKWSVPSLIEHSMYGYSLMGSDICGFVGNTTPQLCARWSTLGAFYTFTRNHNDDRSIDQDPVAMGPEVVEANRNALTKRYSLLPYLYTLIHRANRYGEPVVRSMPFEFFGADKEVFNIEYQFMWGKGLMISPIVDENTYTKSTYLPVGRWYETDVLIDTNPPTNPRVPRQIISQGQWLETIVPLANIPLFYRGGHIMATYPNVKATVAETVEQPIGLEVPLCRMGRAHGELYLDDGDSLDGKLNHAIMKYDETNKLTISMDHDKYSPTIEFGRVKIYGFNATINRVEVNGEPISYNQIDHLLTFDLNGAKVSKDKDIVVEMKNVK